MRATPPIATRLAGLWLAALLAGCSQPGSDLDRLGSATAQIVFAPTGVGCVVIQVVGGSTLTRQFDVAPQGNTVFALEGLPLGNDTFTAQAYSMQCSLRSGAAAAWVSSSVVAKVTANESVRVTLDMSDGAGEGIVAVAFPAVTQAAVAPIGVACVVVQASGASTVNYPFDVAPESSTVLTLFGLPLGSDTFTAQAFPMPCGQRGGAGSTWASAAVTVSVAAGKPASLSLLMAAKALTPGVIAAGNFHTCAVVNGGAQCWGDNGTGQLGNNSTTYSSIPVQVTGLTSGSGVTAIAAGFEHTCAVVNGGAQCWGDNSYGELGNSSTTGSNVPVQVAGLMSGSGVTAIAAGDSFTCAVVNDGVQCWGYNSAGDLGNNSTTNSSVPVSVIGLTSGSGVTAITAGLVHTCALVNGGAQCWGDNSSGALGNNSTTSSSVPVEVTGLTSGVTVIAAGFEHTCAVVNGGVQCWGDDSFGDLGNNSMAESNVLVPVSGLTSGAESIAAGNSLSCAVVKGGAECWGWNSHGQLGNNATTSSPVPVQVSGLTSGVQAIAAGDTHACAVVNGGVQCWGDNAQGELGNNSLADSSVPVQVMGLTSGVGGL
jgi:alpha-tubulin suppressor-like RCC1 family protein